MGLVSPEGLPRTVGVRYVVSGHEMLVSTRADSWKARHVSATPAMSMTVPIWHHLLRFGTIPPATITAHGTAVLESPGDLDATERARLFPGVPEADPRLDDLVVIRFRPENDFVTNGIETTRRDLADVPASQGRARVSEISRLG